MWSHCPGSPGQAPQEPQGPRWAGGASLRRGQDRLNRLGPEPSAEGGDPPRGAEAPEMSPQLRKLVCSLTLELELMFINIFPHAWCTGVSPQSLHSPPAPGCQGSFL